MTRLLHGDCLKLMSEIPNGSVDMVLCDLPYGITACKWDTIIPFEPLWAHYRRVCKKNAAIVLTASQPFTSALVMSNIGMFRYSMVWIKSTPTGYLNAKKMPLRAHEDVLVFYSKLPSYNPIMSTGHVRKTALTVKRSCTKTGVYRTQKGVTSYDSTNRYPKSHILTSTDKQRCVLHPTQKPVALMEYLIHTYTNEGETVLDNCMGSGTTGVACVNTGRNFIGIEMDDHYFEVASKRIKEAEDNKAGMLL